MLFLDQGLFKGFQLSRLCLRNFVFGKAILKYGDYTFQHPILPFLSYFVKWDHSTKSPPSYHWPQASSGTICQEQIISSHGEGFSFFLASSPHTLPVTYMLTTLMKKTHLTRASKVCRGTVNPAMLWYNEHVHRRNYLNTKSDERQLS